MTTAGVGLLQCAGIVQHLCRWGQKIDEHQRHNDAPAQRARRQGGYEVSGRPDWIRLLTNYKFSRYWAIFKNSISISIRISKITFIIFSIICFLFIGSPPSPVQTRRRYYQLLITPRGTLWQRRSLLQTLSSLALPASVYFTIRI